MYNQSADYTLMLQGSCQETCSQTHQDNDARKATRCGHSNDTIWLALGKMQTGGGYQKSVASPAGVGCGCAEWEDADAMTDASKSWATLNAAIAAATAGFSLVAAAAASAAILATAFLAAAVGTPCFVTEGKGNIKGQGLSPSVKVVYA